MPRTTARAPLLRAVAKNGNLGNFGTTAPSGAAIHQTIRRRAEHASYDPTALPEFGGHSLRAGFVTQGTRNGADGAAARQTGHASLDSVEVDRGEHAPLVGNPVRDMATFPLRVPRDVTVSRPLELSGRPSRFATRTRKRSCCLRR